MTGITVRHTRSCKTNDGGGCNCKPSYRACVYDKRPGQKIRKTFRVRDEAKSWRTDAASAVKNKTISTPTKTTLREAAEAWLAGAEEGAIVTRKRQPYSRA